VTVVPIAFANGCLPCVVPSQATALCSHRRSWSKPQRLPGTGPFPTRDGNGRPWSCAGIPDPWCPTGRPRNGSSDLCVRGHGGAAAGAQGALALDDKPGRGRTAAVSPSRPGVGPGARLCTGRGNPATVESAGSGRRHRPGASRPGHPQQAQPSHRGGTRTGSFRVRPTVPRRPARCWPWRPAQGQARALAPRTTSSGPPSTPASRPVSAALPPCLLRRAAPPLWSTHTRVAGLGHLWPPGRDAEGMAGAGVHRRRGSLPVAGSSRQGWRRNRIGPAHGCSGASPTARRLAAAPRRSG
jgi:hypothetical protein